ncbi:NUMOD4 domain-containing protein [Peribacillus frigoritolerans]|uniref:NUMOD4 domain-containing protein n=1 Tax=Peribacillus frigoritolerans TaxID=450367 RepID=UPI003D2A6DB0
MLYLYDPRTNISTETTYKELELLTGKSFSSLATHKSKKMKLSNINCFLSDHKTTVQQRKEWYVKEKYFNEVWKVIEGSDEKFLISNYGRFKRLYKRTDMILLPYLHKRSGNLMIKVQFKNKVKKYNISHLVAYHFVGNPKQGEVLHHKNLIKTDNYFVNLEFITNEKLGKKTGFKSSSKPVVRLDKDTMEVLEEYRSVREAGRKCFFSYQTVLDRCNKKSKPSDGNVFMFAEEYELLESDLSITE